MVKIIIESRESGKTVAAVIRERLQIPWSEARKIILQRIIRYNQQPVTQDAMRVKIGKILEIPVHLFRKNNKNEIEDGQNPNNSSTASTTTKKSNTTTNFNKSKPSPLESFPLESSSLESSSLKSTPKDRSNQTASKKEITHQNSRKNPSLINREEHKTSLEKKKQQSKYEFPEELEPKIVYVDDDLVVINKPTGITTMRHEEEAKEFGLKGKKYLPYTALDRVAFLLGVGRDRIYAVHRIDRDTSGLVVFARTNEVKIDLEKQFRSHEVERRYLALVHGKPDDQKIVSWFVDDRGDGRRGSASKEIQDPKTISGKKAITHISTKATWGEISLVECSLETGRTHQIRIHLGEIGCPICGEKIYNRPVHGKPYYPLLPGANRPFLHSFSMQLYNNSLWPLFGNYLSLANLEQLPVTPLDIEQCENCFRCVLQGEIKI